MEPPEDAIETLVAFIWLEDGMVFAQGKNSLSTPKSVKELFAAGRKLVGGAPRPTFLDARRSPMPGPAEWGTAISDLASTCTAVAMLITPETPANVNPFPYAIDRLMIPFQVFTDEAEALAFLREYLPSRQPVLEPPDDAIETATSSIWIEDGIVHTRSKGVPTTSVEAREAFDTLRNLFSGVPGPAFFDARKWPGGDIDEWTAAVGELDSVTAFAILVEPGSQVAKGPFNSDRLPVPFRFFTDASEALNFLRGFLPSE